MKETPGAPAFSQEMRRRTPKANAFARLQSQAKTDKKFNNSTNSLYISETPTAPDERELTLCAAKAVAVLLQTDESNKGGNQSRTPPPQRLMLDGKEPRELVFDERVHPLKMGLKKGVPTREEVYEFMRIIYKRTRMQPECIVMTVSYIEKVLRDPLVVLTAHTWRRIVLAALVVADKVFEGERKLTHTEVPLTHAIPALCLCCLIVFALVFLQTLPFGTPTSSLCSRRPTFRFASPPHVARVRARLTAIAGPQHARARVSEFYQFRDDIQSVRLRQVSCGGGVYATTER